MKNSIHSLPPYSLAVILFVFGSILLMFYSMVLGFDKLGPMEVDGRDIGIVILRSQHPLGFFISEAILLIAGVEFYFASAYVLFKKINVQFSNVSKRTPLWKIINIATVALSLWGGYASLDPKRLAHTNPDIILCLIILVVIPFFSIGTVWYSVKECKCDSLRTPSWDRNPYNWWYDPLQALFMMRWIMFGMALGSLIRIPTYGSIGFWTLGVYFCCAAGTAIGQFFVYKIYRDRIIRK